MLRVSYRWHSPDLLFRCNGRLDRYNAFRIMVACGHVSASLSVHGFRAGISNVATASGLRLGLTQKQVQEIAGKPTKSGSAIAKYEYACRAKLSAEQIKDLKDANKWDATSDPYFDRMSWVDV